MHCKLAGTNRRRSRAQTGQAEELKHQMSFQTHCSRYVALTLWSMTVNRRHSAVAGQHMLQMCHTNTHMHVTELYQHWTQHVVDEPARLWVWHSHHTKVQACQRHQITKYQRSQMNRATLYVTANMLQTKGGVQCHKLTMVKLSWECLRWSTCGGEKNPRNISKLHPSIFKYSNFLKGDMQRFFTKLTKK